jgi:hypothetical protein
MERIVWQYWENSYKYPDGIPYIDLCHQSVDLHQTSGKGYKVVRLNDTTVTDYITLNPLLNLTKDPCLLAQKADYIRAKLVCKYGGMWLDSDTIVLGSLDSIFDKLEQYEFFGYDYKGQCITVWAFASRANGELITKWSENNDNVLKLMGGKNIYFGEMGHRSLNLFKDECMCLFEDSKLVHPISHDEAWKYLFLTDDVNKYLNKNQPFFMANNAMIDHSFKKQTKQEWFESKNLLSQILVKSGVFETV